MQFYRDAGAKLRLILLYGEFYSADATHGLAGLGVRYLIPYTNRDAAVETLRDCTSGRRMAVSSMAMSNSDRKENPHYAAVTDRRRRKRSKPDAPEDRLIAFAANARRVDAVKYGKRRGIETGYRTVERMRAKTSGRSPTVRAFHFWYSLPVFGLWVIANAILGRGTGWGRKADHVTEHAWRDYSEQDI